jgi:hypothetical protein
MKKLFFVLLIGIAFNGCALPTASDDLNGFIGKKFTNKKYPQFNQNGNLYSRAATNSKWDWLYKIEKDGLYTRYYINFFKHCRYSLLVNTDDVIISWRDEGGETHVSKCRYS